MVCLFAATGLYFIIAGQHQFCAAMEIKNKRSKEMKEVPSWCKIFRCKVVKVRVTNQQGWIMSVETAWLLFMC